MQNNTNQTKGVKILLGDPKKAVFKLAIPIIAANFIQTIYHLADAVWVAGLGSLALAAVGLFFPFFYISLALSLGISIGGGSAISRKIGAHDQNGAGEVALHTFILTTVLAIVFIVPLYLFIDKILASIGAGQALELAVIYAKIMIIGSVFLLFSNLCAAILRAEGDSKRAMIALAIGTVLNIFLDPLFIYGFKLGVAGAAWATLLSMGISLLIMANWLFFKKDTFIPIHIKTFVLKMNILKDIFKVGLPASVQHIAMSLSMFVLNIIVVNLAGPDGIAVLTTGWRVFMIGSMPIFGFAAAIVSLSGAAYGAKNIPKLKISYLYAIKSAILIELTAGVLLFTFAPYIVYIFTYTQNTAHITSEIINFLRITAFAYPALALGPISSSVFQGIGKGFNALIVTIVRSLILLIPLTLFFAYVLDLGLTGVWWGIVTANLTGASLSFLWTYTHINKMLKKKSFEEKAVYQVLPDYNRD
ncbi:MATE family efflux transporter [Candidatus Margulisiibacteriota bacterium]